MKICIGQINTTPGDFEGNLDRVLTGMENASAADCDLLVFPELTIPGYLSQDLIYNPGFVDRNLQVLQEICEHSRKCLPKLHVVLGYIDRNTDSGKPFRNMAAVIRHGEIVASYQKQLLPFYDVFDELRYFEPGNEPVIVTIDDRQIGLAICEDLWNDKGSDDYAEEDNPLAQYRDLNVDIVVSLNSSPYVQGKCLERLSKIAPGRDDMSIVYVNQIGGQDELVFDGQSFVMTGDNLAYLNSEVFADSYDIVDLDRPALPVEPSYVALEDLLVLGLRDYVRKSGFEQLVLASSGGVDSAVVCKLACQAIGPENVHAIRMPSRFSSDHSLVDARELHEKLGCWDYEVPIEHDALIADLNQRFDIHENQISEILTTNRYNTIADENIQARLRDLYVMHFSNAFGAMPLSTGNKTESGCGYYTHFDMNFSYAPIKDLYKFEVVALAQTDADIPEHIWKKPPSAELSTGQTDEDSLLPYAVLDPIVMSYVEDYVTTFEDFCAWVERSERTISMDSNKLMHWLDSEEAKSDYERIVSLIGRMEYKRRQTCPGTKVSKVAFGIGRRIPIVEKWS